jgi:hypothetical protein
LQGDGNIVEYTHSGTPFWNSDSRSSNPGYLQIEADGNFAAYTSADVKYWTSSNSPIGSVSSRASNYLTVQCDGHLAVKNIASTGSWFSGRWVSATASTGTPTNCCPAGTNAVGDICVGIKRQIIVINGKIKFLDYCLFISNHSFI